MDIGNQRVLTPPLDHAQPISANEQSNSPRGDRGFKVAIAVIVFTVIGVLGAWVYLDAIVSWDQHLWYLNWRPGAYSLVAFTGIMSKAMVFAVLCVGTAVALAKQTPVPAIVSVVFATMLIGVQCDGAVRWFAEKSRIAQIDCYDTGTRRCVLNEFHRMYDLGWSRSMTPGEAAAYREYVTLRQRAKLGKPESHWNTAHAQALHQAELTTWASRFKPELDTLLDAFPEPGSSHTQ